jgi:hypothetical protein
MKHNLFKTAIFVAFIAIVIAVTAAQLRYRETELEWYSTNFNGTQIKFLTPLGWRPPNVSVRESGTLRPPGRPLWYRSWMGSLFTSNLSSDDRIMLWMGANTVSVCDGQLTIHLAEAKYKYCAFQSLPGDSRFILSYTRTDKRIFDATHKRICDSLQLVTVDHRSNK